MPAPDPRVTRWIRRELASERLRAPSLIVSIWGDAIAPHADEIWLSTLFRLLAPFGVNERAVRTGMFRLARSGWLEARPVGRRSRYRLTPDGAEGFDRAFHRVYDPPFAPWDGEWEGVIVDAERAAPALRRRASDELAWAGYGRFGPGVFLRPARRDGVAERIADSLRMAEAMTLFSARDPGDSRSASLSSRTAAVWSLDALAGEYRRFLARFGGLASALGETADAEQAFAVRILLVHAYRRSRLRDPQLPREVLAGDWPGAAAHALCRKVYRLALPRSEAHLATVLAADGERLSPARPRLSSRFAHSEHRRASRVGYRE